MCSRTEKRRAATRGQATVEAAFGIPVLFTLLLLLVQPGLVLYDRMVMAHAAAEGCRLLATSGDAAGLSQATCRELVKRQLSAIPPHELFHVHDPECSWEIVLSGDETSAEVSVGIRNKLKLLPLFDAAGTLLGLADAQGQLSIEVSRSCPTQAEWVARTGQGLAPQEWANARKGD